jgi:hypothetical protein
VADPQIPTGYLTDELVDWPLRPLHNGQVTGTVWFELAVGHELRGIQETESSVALRVQLRRDHRCGHRRRAGARRGGRAVTDRLLLAGWATVRAGWAVAMVVTCSALAVYDVMPRLSLTVSSR